MSAIVSKIESILTNAYSSQNFVELMSEVLHGMQIVAPNIRRKEHSNFSSHIESNTHVGTYVCPNKNKIIIMSVELKKLAFVENSRSTQRSYAKQFIESVGADGAIVAYYTEGETRWRLSFVRLDYEMQIEKGKHKVKENITPARRYSFLVGKDEPCHTAISRFRIFLDRHKVNPTLDELEEAFSVESVTKEFFELYKEKFFQLRDYLEKNEQFVSESKLRNYTSAQFAKKLMGQIVFLYFLQKKGWLGVKAWPPTMTAAEYKSAFYKRGARSRELIPLVYQQVEDGVYRVNASALSKLSDEEEHFLSSCVKGEPWGTGPYNFMRRLFEISEKKGANFFEAYLEPLFYNALNVNRGEQGYDPALHCRIPFLSGGLFEPLDGYEWEHNNFAIPNEMFSNKTKGNDRLADGILDIFDNYNFTMSEDEPLEREVAIDPEMLGKVFENLLEVNDRKSKGAFYTPREIVHYMCQESLISYLTRVMKVKESAIRDFIMVGDFMKDEDASVLKRAEKGESYDLWISEELYLLGKDGSIIVDRMAELDRALQDVRVADPAVGSGAFPLGMLNEIVRARQNITTYMDITQKIRDPKGAGREIRYRRINERSAHRLKYETIRNCIFAVDIEPSAVDIAQLRLWLALVIDDEIDPNAATDLDGHRNPLPLPNLECNILCGDSLLDEFEGYKLINDSDLIGNAANNTQIDAYRSAFNATLERLIEKQEELFRCDNTVKKAVLLNQIEDLRNSIIMIQLESANAEAVERYKETRHLATKPFILWQLDFARVFRAKGGFDIVIGNPPYIQLQKAIDEDSGKKLGDLYSSYGFETFAKTGDIYCLFYEKGNMLLRQGGILSFITSNKWMRAGYGKSLRQYLANNTNPLILIDFSGTKVFTTATVDVNILMFSKESNAERTMAVIAKDDCLSNLSVYIMQNYSRMHLGDSGSWTILSSVENQIKEKIEASGTLLKQLDISINFGIKTGYNDAFIIDDAKRIELISTDSRSAELIRPILRGRDVKRYEFDYSGLWLISTFPSLNIDIDCYPAIKNHLLSFGYERLEQSGRSYIINGEKVKSRKKTNNKWFETQDSISYWDEFSKQKIIWKRIGSLIRFAYDDEGYLGLDSTCMATGDHIKFVSAFLNSIVGNHILSSSPKTGTGDLLISVQALDPIRVPLKAEKACLPIIETILEKSKTKQAFHEEEMELDTVLFDYYGFTSKERDFLRKSTKIYR